MIDDRTLEATAAGRAAQPAVAYSYLRLSSKRQLDTGDDGKGRRRDGLRRQIELRDRYLAENPHLTLDTTLVLEDIGVSGFTGANSAPGGAGKLALFLAEVRAGRIPEGSYFLVESLDRMSRQQVSQAQADLLAIVNAGIVVVSLMDGQVYHKGASPTQFIISIMAATRAHEESVTKSFRLRKTWEEKRRNALTTPIMGRAPAWLDRKPDRYVPNRKKVKIVNEILRLLADGVGRDTIASMLNARDVKPWGHGRKWHGGTIQKITDNRALLGEFQPHKLDYVARKGIMVPKRVPVGEPIPGYFPRVVEQELWDAARLVANARALKRPHNGAGRVGSVISNLFGTVATCGSCGAPMNFRDRGPRSTPVLRCSSERAGACDNDYRIPYPDTENAILSWLVELDLSGGAPGEAAKLNEALVARIARQQELQVQGETIVSHIGRGTRFSKAPLEAIERELSEVEAEILDLSGRLRVLNEGGAREDRGMAVAALMQLARRKAKAENPEEASAIAAETFAVRARIRQIIRNTFRGMRCMPDGHIEIETIDGRGHRFRDGYWWNEEVRDWIPWAGAMFGGGYRATRAELVRRRIWLEEHRRKRAEAQ
ncbi:recombinase family protein [Methylobacterium sp. D48H]